MTEPRRVHAIPAAARFRPPKSLCSRSSASRIASRKISSRDSRFSTVVMSSNQRRVAIADDRVEAGRLFRAGPFVKLQEQRLVHLVDERAPPQRVLERFVERDHRPRIDHAIPLRELLEQHGVAQIAVARIAPVLIAASSAGQHGIRRRRCGDRSAAPPSHPDRRPAPSTADRAAATRGSRAVQSRVIESGETAIDLVVRRIDQAATAD